MAVRDNGDRGLTHGYEAKGYSAANDKARSRALNDLEATLAGPKPPKLANPRRTRKRLCESGAMAPSARRAGRASYGDSHPVRR